MWGVFFQPEDNYQQTCKSGDHSKAKKLNRLNTSNLRGISQLLTSAHLFPSTFWSVWQLCPCRWFLCCAHRHSTLPEHSSEAAQIAAVFPAQHAEGAHDLLLLLLYQKGIQQQCFPPGPQSPKHSCRNCLEHRRSKEWPIRFGENRKAAVGSRPVPLL